MGSIFDGYDTTLPPLTADTFTQTIVEEYASETESIGIDACIGAAVDDAWPAPEYRENQREAIVELLHALYVDDNDVATLSAPTGAGKSLIIYGAIKTLDNVFGRKSFFTTPLNALIDQVDGDDFIGDEVLTLKGKNNYNCIHPHDAGTSVDKAICQRTDEFECQYKDMHHESGGCQYYGRRKAAQTHEEVVTNLSYLMANSMIPENVDSKLDARELIVIDECQSIEDFALQFVSVVVNDEHVPVEGITNPPRTDDIDTLVSWLKTDVLPPVNTRIDMLDMRGELTEKESDDLEDLQQFARKVENLLYDIQDHHWVADVERTSAIESTSGAKVVENDEDSDSVKFNPIFVGRFLERYLWSQGNKVILSSATIPKGSFLEEVGLDDRSVHRVEVESTFPVNRRPVYTDTVGKMTMSQRKYTIPKMGTRIGEIAEHHWDENHRGFVHCHSYSIAAKLYDELPEAVKLRTRVQDNRNREESLDAWLDAPVDERGYSDDEGGQVFLSVAMDEGISLDDWRARWQVVAKAAYPFMGAKRVSYRMDELDDWTWYANTASINLQQAVGRGMRSKDDWCHTYILDKSAVDLIDRNAYLFEDWFLNAVGVDMDSSLPSRA